MSHSAATLTLIIRRESANAELRWIPPNEMRIDFICSMDKRKGHASLVMTEICELADSFGYDVSLLPVANSGLTLKKLKEWYGSYEFEDYDDGMIRRFKGSRNERT